ncbi:MAG: response regulator, partial [Oligoflexus sp.]
SGREGISMADQLRPDIILLDMMMPDCSGEDVLQHLHQDQNHAAIPVIIVTARAGEEDRLRALSTGADDYISKPILENELVFRLVNLANRSKLTKQIAVMEAAEQAAVRTSNILNSIDQALFITGLDAAGTLVIKGDTQSAKCCDILAFPSSKEWFSFETYFYNKIKADPSSKIEFYEAIKSVIGLDELSWNLNSAKFLHKADFIQLDQVRHISLTYAPLYSRTGDIQEIIITASDQTEALLAELEVRNKNQKMNLIIELTSLGKATAKRGISSIQNSANEANRLMLSARKDSWQSLQELMKVCFIPIHTAKGNARTLGFNRLATDLHAIEDRFALLQKSHTHLSLEDANKEIEHAISSMGQICQDLGAYFDIMKQLGWETSGDVNIPLEAFMKARVFNSWAEIRQAVDQNKDPSGQLESFLSPLFRPVKGLHRSFEICLQRAASATKKNRPTLTSNLDGLWLYTEIFEKIELILPHIAGNILDHGIESSEVRIQKNRSMEGQVRFEAHLCNDHLHLMFEDDGQGVSMAQLSQILLARGLKSQAELHAMTLDEVLNLLFSDGLSLKEQISEVSGRGVGMSALKSTMREIGGDALLSFIGSEDKEGRRPIRLTLSVPKGFVWV